MIKLFTLIQLYYSKSTDLLPIKCSCCKKIFYIEQKYILSALNNINTTKYKYCSVNCKGMMLSKKQDVNCATCGKFFQKKSSQISKTINNFCTRSCAAIYNNSKYPKRKKV